MGRINWLTVISISVSSVLLTVIFHESVHAIVCLAVGGEIQQFSAVHVSCSCDADWKSRLVAGSASIANLALASLIWPLLRKARSWPGNVAFFVWLFFSMNLFTGTGYWFASGLMGLGDWASVIRGWQPWWLYRGVLLILGSVTLMIAVSWALIEFGRLIDRSAPKPIGRAQTVGIVCYATSFVTMLLVGLAQPGGPIGFASIMSLIAVLGGFSPLLWMMQWFRADMFKLRGTRSLDIEFSVGGLILGAALFFIAIAATVVGSRAV